MVIVCAAWPTGGASNAVEDTGMGAYLAPAKDADVRKRRAGRRKEGPVDGAGSEAGHSQPRHIKI